MKSCLLFLSFGCIFSSLSCDGAIAGASNPPIKIPAQGRRGNDPNISEQWYLNHIGITRSWVRFGQGKPEISIAVLDSGLDYNHPEIAANVWHNEAEIMGNGTDDDKNGAIDDAIGWDFVNGNGLPFDRSGHGTMMSTIIAGIRGNGLGGAGACPSCSIMPVRFLNWEGDGDDADAIAGVYYAAKSGAKVLNLSFAGEGSDKSMERALAFAASRDVFIVAAAGNDQENINRTSVYPAKYTFPTMITVAASDRHDRLSEGSNWGNRYVHLAAPGEDLYGFWLGDWDKGDGTSNAAALVSGAIGLIRSAAPALTAAQVKKVVLATVRKSSELKEKVVSGGVIDVEAAIACAKDPSLPCLR